MSHEPGEESIGFGSMRLFRKNRLLLDGETPVRLGSRAFDLLVVLVEHAGQVVTKEQLVARVWPRSFVEETSLRVHIGALRKVLGDGQEGFRYIVNVPGRGYSFVAPVTTLSARERPPAPVASPAAFAPKPRLRTTNLPARLTRMLGRQGDVSTVTSLLKTRRLVTIAGAGGIGKTTLALAVAEEVLGQFDDAIFVDLAVLSDGDLIASSIGSTLGVCVSTDAPMRSLANQLADKRLLLLLDNCEHVIEKAAQLAVLLLRSAPALRILATSREPLRADGEHVRRLSPLASPPESATLTAGEAMAFPAVQLLIERVTSSSDSFLLLDPDATAAAELCRRLDGIPLAIELAAVRVGFFGMRELLARLDDRLRLLSNGHRTVLPRHQTLRALYDWSYHLLTEPSQAALRRLSVFPGAFSLESAVALASSPGDDPVEAEERVIDLAAKSLIAIDLGNESARYRLLESTRAYAAEKLAQSGEREDIRHRHAEHVIDLLARANPQWDGLQRHQWLGRYASLIDDVRTAFDWAYAPPGDAVLGARLTQVAFQLAQQLSLFEEFRFRIEHALAGLRQSPVPAPLLEMELGVALSAALGQINPPGGLRHQALHQAAEAIRAGGAAPTAPHIPYGQWVTSFGHGDYPASLQAAQAMESLSAATGDGEGLVIGQRMLAQSWHFLGEHARAREYAYQVLRAPAKALRIGGKMLDPVDRRVSMRIILSRILWLQGLADQATATVHEALALAREDMGYVQCQVLGMAACPIALWTGDEAMAAAHAESLAEAAERHALGYWKTWAQALGMVLAGRFELGPLDLGNKLHDLMGTLCCNAVDAALLSRSEGAMVGWCSAEHLRAHAENLLRGADPHAGRAAQLFRRAIDLAREQGALAWELRAATSLCRLQQQSPGEAGDDGLALLRQAHDRHTEGFATRDMRQARALLDPAQGGQGQAQAQWCSLFAPQPRQ